MIHGIDIGGSKIEHVRFDDALNVVDRRRVATPTKDYDAFLNAVVDLVRGGASGSDSIDAVGVGVPGLVDSDGRSFCSNVPCATGRTVAADLSARLGRPVVAENDCRLFALSEAVGGAGADHHLVFGAILGTGAGAGMVVDGRVMRGARGIAGEYGHLAVPAHLMARHALPSRTCGCGLTDCFEAYVAGPGLVAMARHFGCDVPDGAAVFTAWRAGDAAAAQTYAAFLDLLGAALANVVKLVDPDVIVMGGGLSQVDEAMAALPAAIGAHLFAGYQSPPVVAARFGDASGVRGAALLARAALRSSADAAP